MTTKLSPACFLVFASVIYADGQVRRGELEGFRRAARVHGVDAQELERIEARARAGVLMSEIELPAMSTWEKALTYAFAIWIAKVDGIINSAENEMIRELGDILQLAKLRRDAARSATYDIAALPGGHQPERYDFAALEAQLETKLPGSFRRHRASRDVTSSTPDESSTGGPSLDDHERKRQDAR